MTRTLPTSDVDPFSDPILDDPYPWYAELRSMGPVVLLDRYDVVALSHFDDVRTALRNWRTFISTAGVGFNDAFNEQISGTVLAMQPPDHDAVRAVLNRYLKLSEVRSFAPLAERVADEMVTRLAEQGTFEAIGELAEPYVTSVVGELLGVPAGLLEVFLRGSIAGFTAVGPFNERTMSALPALDAQRQALAGLTKVDFAHGSIGRHIIEAEERGEIPEVMRDQLLVNFMGPAFDTTVNAIGSILWLLATHPDQWELLVSDRSLVPAVINEGLRFESPVQIWSRVAPESVQVGEAMISGGTRVAILLGSANRDERHYARADQFEVKRNPTDHLGLGHGIHLCVGAPLARLEMTCVLNALLERVRSIELIEPPERRLNNTTRGLERLRLTIKPN